MKHTAYNSDEVVDWHNAFLEDNPEGTLGKVTHRPSDEAALQRPAHSKPITGLDGLGPS